MNHNLPIKRLQFSRFDAYYQDLKYLPEDLRKFLKACTKFHCLNRRFLKIQLEFEVVLISARKTTSNNEIC